jgi:hypothetical protein
MSKFNKFKNFIIDVANNHKKPEDIYFKQFLLKSSDFLAFNYCTNKFASYDFIRSLKE